MIDIFKDLNENQKKAVIATEGHVRVNAGAGSGKTKTLTCRYAYLVNGLGIDPAHILCLTFTNKAAKEMAFRISKMVSIGHVNDYVSTIHGFCVKFLRKEIYRLGYPKSFTIFDEEDTKILAQQVMDELNIKREKSTIKGILKDVSITKNRAPYIDWFMLPSSEINEDIKVSIDEKVILYLQKQAKYYSLDFNDLIYFTIYILNHFEDAKAYWQNEINYMMVDETQDCNKSDWQIINAISEVHKNLFIVGDVDQAIYEWRGAKPDFFVDFEADQDITLEENYRSTPNILNTANSIIINNKMRLSKNLFTHKNGGTCVIHFHGKNEKEEANWIKEQISKLVKSGAKNSDFAILYRASYLSRYIEEALMSGHIKYTIWGGIRFFERKEIKDSLSYLRLVDHDDDVSFLRIINTPSRKLGKVFVSKLIKLAEAGNATLYATLKTHIKDDDLNRPTALEFINAVEDCRKMILDNSIVEVLSSILKKSGLQESIRIDGDEERLENVDELINSIKYYEEVNKEENINLNTYLQDIALYTNADYKNDTESVKLMTIHQAKGLEFPYVFVVGLTEGVFPSWRTIRERKQNGLEEERRLMYVAVTRAEKSLFLTESEGYNYMSHQEKYPSRFLAEIKKNLFVTEGTMDENLWEGTNNLVESLDREINNTEEESNSLRKGDKVKHDVFGEGIVLSFDKDKDSCEVQFGENKRFIRSSFLTIIGQVEENENFNKINDELSTAERDGKIKGQKQLSDYINELEFNNMTQQLVNINNFYKQIVDDNTFISKVKEKVNFNFILNGKSDTSFETKVKSMLMTDITKSYLQSGGQININTPKGIALLQMLNVIWMDQLPIEYAQLNISNNVVTYAENIINQIKNGLDNMALDRDDFFISLILSSYNKEIQKKYLWKIYDFIAVLTSIDDNDLNGLKWKSNFEQFINKL